MATSRNDDDEPHVTTPSTDISDYEKATSKLEGPEVDETEVGEIEVDENTVWWDGENDAANPLNWPLWKKTVNIGLISFLTFAIPLATATFSPAVPSVMAGFNETSKPLTNFVSSDSTLGAMFGPLLVAPLSEIYGRLPVYHACNVMFVFILAACAFAPSLGTLIFFRFVGGIFSCCPTIIGTGSIFDIVHQRYRGPVIATWTGFMLLSGLVGPVVGGLMAGSLGWRWTFKFLAILNAAVAVVMMLATSESYAPVLLRRKTARLRRETGNPLLRSRLDDGMSHAEYLKHSFVRPFKILVRSPYAQALCAYSALIMGFFAVAATSIAPMFIQIYHIPTSFLGMTFMGIMTGSISGLVWFGILSSRKKVKAETDGGDGSVGYGLKMLPVGPTLLTIGYMVYGWTARESIHWIVPILSHLLIGCGLSLVLGSVSMALVDAFTLYSASANAVNTVISDVFAATMPLFGLEMYAAVGMGWGNTILAAVSLLMIPVAFLLKRYSEYLRTAYPVKNI